MSSVISYLWKQICHIPSLMGYHNDPAEADPRLRIQLCVDQLAKKNLADIKKEFRSIEKAAPKYSSAAAYSDAAQGINRYEDIVPFDSTRVCLKSQPSTYINASHVPGFQCDYIAAQAPTEAGMEGFFYMIAEQQVPVVIMLTRLQEGNHRKADPYLPEAMDSPISFGAAKIALLETLDSEDSEEGFSVRKYQVTIPGVTGDEGHPFYHLHYRGWPDHGVPDSSESLRHLLRKTEHCRQDLSDDCMSGPLLVHCSAGVGRTGTFIAAKEYLDRVRSGEEKPIQDIVTDLRNRRRFLVMRACQYEFVYKVALDDLSEDG